MSQPGLQSEGYLTSIPSRDNNQRTLRIVSPIWKICWLLWILRIPSRPLLSRRNLWCTLPVTQNLDWFSILSDSVDITLKSFDALFLPLVTIQKKKKMQFSHALHSFIFCVQVYPTIATCLLLIFLQINSSLASTPNYFPFLWFSECLQECKEPHCFREFSVTGSFSCITNTLGDNGWWEEGFMICRASSFQPLNIFLYVHRSYYPWESAY